MIDPVLTYKNQCIINISCARTIFLKYFSYLLLGYLLFLAFVKNGALLIIFELHMHIVPHQRNYKRMLGILRNYGDSDLGLTCPLSLELFPLCVLPLIVKQPMRIPLPSRGPDQ